MDGSVRLHGDLPSALVCLMGPVCPRGHGTNDQWVEYLSCGAGGIGLGSDRVVAGHRIQRIWMEWIRSISGEPALTGASGRVGGSIDSVLGGSVWRTDFNSDRAAVRIGDSGIAKVEAEMGFHGGGFGFRGHDGVRIEGGFAASGKPRGDAELRGHPAGGAARSVEIGQNGEGGGGTYPLVGDRVGGACSSRPLSLAGKFGRNGMEGGTGVSSSGAKGSKTGSSFASRGFAGYSWA